MVYPLPKRRRRAISFILPTVLAVGFLLPRFRGFWQCERMLLTGSWAGEEPSAAEPRPKKKGSVHHEGHGSTTLTTGEEHEVRSLRERGHSCLRISAGWKTRAPLKEEKRGEEPFLAQRPSYRWKTVSRFRGWTPVFTGVTIRKRKPGQGPFYSLRFVLCREATAFVPALTNSATEPTKLPALIEQTYGRYRDTRCPMSLVFYQPKGLVRGTRHA
jgi:hypothetical protein